MGSVNRGQVSRLVPRSQSNTILIAIALLVSTVGMAWIAGVPDPRSAAPRHPRFAPSLLGVELAADTVRPGEALSYTLSFANDGDAPAGADLTVFVHMEPVGGDCSAIAAQHDHDPRVSTRLWRSERTIVDGPRLMTIPADAPEGEYALHVGLFDRSGGGARFVEGRSNPLRIDCDAPPAALWKPGEVPLEEVARRDARSTDRIQSPDYLEGAGWTFALDPSGGWALEDLRTGLLWTADPAGTCAFTALVDGPAGIDEVAIARFESVRVADGTLQAEARVPIDDGARESRVTLVIRPTDDGEGVRFSWSTVEGFGGIVALRLLDRALPTPESQAGSLLLPRYLGQVLPAGEGLPHARAYRSNDLTLSMCGVLRGDSALLATWSGDEWALTTHLEARDSPLFPAGRTWTLSFDLPPGDACLELRPLGAGSWPDVARAYRAIAERNGTRRTWAEKKAECPRLEQLEGAPVFRFPCLVRAAPRTRFNPGDHEVREQAYTFEEVARIARHWRDDLGLDRAHVVVSGWGREGYDRGHPDILPANAESGGDAALAACAERVRSLGYLFTLHDNYSDIYPAAPSWDPAVLRRDARGAPRTAGQWAGGQAWRVCPIEQSRFARRNLPQVAAAYRPGGYFLDTTLTPALEACHAPLHPLSRRADPIARRELFAYARSEFGVLGLEGAAEWAVTEAAWFEGLLTHKTVHRPGWIVVPLFPMVYSDCLALVPIQADKLDVDDARKVLDLALYGAMPSFEFGPHLYYEREARTVPIRAEVARFEPTSERTFRLALRWRADEAVGIDVGLFVHFTRADSPAREGIDLQHDWVPARPTSSWSAGEVVEEACPLLEVPADADGPWEIRVGAHRGGDRLALEGTLTVDRRTLLGVLRRDGGQLVLGPPPVVAGSDAFARADGGWAAGLCATDRLIKNVSEVLGPLGRLVAGRLMTGHSFLTADRSVERTVFGDVVITANYGQTEFVEGWVRLPPNGLRIESPTFVAFHATRFAGIDYPGGALFTLRSLDGQPLRTSGRVRIFHGFGTSQIRLGGELLDVPREFVWEPPAVPR